MTRVFLVSCLGSEDRSDRFPAPAGPGVQTSDGKTHRDIHKEAWAFILEKNFSGGNWGLRRKPSSLLVKFILLN